MPAELPVLRIHDTDFYVDLRGMQFIQVDQPSNRIHFDVVKDDRTESVIFFDTSTKNAFKGTWAELRQATTVVEVRLPSLAELDPPTMMAILIETRASDDLLRAARMLEKVSEQRKPQLKNRKRK